MKKNDEMIKRVAREFGDRVPNFVTMNSKMLISRIENVELATSLEARERTMQKLMMAMADMSVWYDVLMEYYGIEWSDIEALITEPEIDNSIRAIKK